MLAHPVKILDGGRCDGIGDRPVTRPNVAFIEVESFRWPTFRQPDIISQLHFPIRTKQETNNNCLHDLNELASFYMFETCEPPLGDLLLLVTPVLRYDEKPNLGPALNIKSPKPGG